MDSDIRDRRAHESVDVRFSGMSVECLGLMSEPAADDAGAASEPLVATDP